MYQNPTIGGHKMPQQVSDINIQEDILRLLDKVVKTGVPLEIERKGKRLLISPAKKHRDLDCLENHQDFVVGNPDDLIHIDWTSEWKPQL
jgi:hypothetical protein